MSEPVSSILVDSSDPTLRGVAASLRAVAGAPCAPDAASDDADEPSGPIAMPVGASPPPRGLSSSDVAIALDAGGLELASDAGVRQCVALAPGLSLSDFEGLDADAVFVAHEALVDAAVERGAARARVSVVGPVAPEGWAPSADRAALRAAHPAGDDERPWLVVRAAALDVDDLSAALVQLSLVSAPAVWLFDVGGDPELARALRRRVPGHGLAAWMFADADALDAYAACDVVLGSIRGPSLVRAMAVGASMLAVPPRSDDARLANDLEQAGVVDFADALATLAVTLDAGLAPAAIERGRAASLELDAAGGAARVLERVGALHRGEGEGAALASGLPVGFERLDEGDERPVVSPSSPREDDGAEDERIDAELAALRQKLGL